MKGTSYGFFDRDLIIISQVVEIPSLSADKSAERSLNVFNLRSAIYLSEVSSVAVNTPNIFPINILQSKIKLH